MPILARRKPEAASFVSPERTSLAAAIAALREADAAHSAATAATAWNGLAVQARHAAAEAVTAAQEALEQAKRGAALYLQAEAMGDAGEPPRSIREARAALLDAEDALFSAREGEQALQPIIDEAERRRPYLIAARDKALRAVLLAEAGQTARNMAASIRDMQSKLFEACTAYQLLCESGAVLTDGTARREPADEADRHALDRFYSAPASWHMLAVGRMQVSDAGVAAWRIAIAALREDAAAVLPA